MLKNKVLADSKKQGNNKQLKHLTEKHWTNLRHSALVIFGRDKNVKGHILFDRSVGAAY